MRMKRLLKVLALFLIMLAGCTPLKTSGTAATSSPGAAPATIYPPIPTSSITTSAGSMSSPTPTLTGHTPPATNGWQQYQNAGWGITVAYPMNWSVSENNGEVIFKAPAGGIIRLDQIQANNLSPQDFLNQDQLPNTRCRSGENPDGVQYRSCFDTIALSTTAYLVISPPQGPAQFFTLSTFERGNLDVFDSMLASFHPS
jgi:hypothetical protein